MKGIILIGREAADHNPVTSVISRELMPIHDKPMIYYQLSVLMQAGISEILIITSARSNEGVKRLLGNGNEQGCRFEYAVQSKPDGLAEAFLIGEDFIGNDKVALLAGDNIFFGPAFSKLITRFKEIDGAAILAYPVADPEKYAVVEFNEQHQVLSIEEKSDKPGSRYAVPGLYFYDNKVVELTRNLKPSSSGKYEITDLNRVYLQSGTLQLGVINLDITWLEAISFESFIDASENVRLTEIQKETRIACVEEIAYRQHFIGIEQLAVLAKKYNKSSYGKYLLNLIKHESLVMCN